MPLVVPAVNMTGESSHVVNKLIDKGIPETNAEQLAQSLPRYWGVALHIRPCLSWCYYLFVGFNWFCYCKNSFALGFTSSYHSWHIDVVGKIFSRLQYIFV